MSNLGKMRDYLQREGIKSTVNRVFKKLGLTDSLKREDERYYRLSNTLPEDYPDELMDWYYEKTGKKLNLDRPQTFNEKLQWLKLYDSSSLKTKLADKYLMREWIKEKIGEEYLIPLLGKWDRFDDINFQKLPDRFALKANHGSGWNIIVTDKNKLDMVDAKKKFDKWMETNFAFVGGLEIHYKDIQPKIIAEKYIENTNGLVDYRFYCFHGNPVQVWVDIFSGTPQHKREIYDMNWEKVPLKCTWPKANGLLDKKPYNFEKMKEFARILSADFKFVRVDFFEIENKLYMGEMTFIPMSGIGKFEPEDWDYKLGELINLSK